MKIAQFSDTFLPVVDGVGRVVSQYALELGKRCEECYVIAPEVVDFYRGGLPFDIITYLGSPVPKNRQYRAGIPTADAHYRKRMEALRVDLVHAHAPFVAGWEAMRYARKNHVPIVGSFHSKYYDDFYQFTNSRSLSRIAVDQVVRFYERCDEVWAVSRATADVLHEYGCKRPVQIMENGMDIKEPNGEAAKRVSEQCRLPVDVPVLLFVGQINWKKNLEKVIRALYVCRRNNVNFVFVCAGRGPHEQEVAVLVNTLGLDDSVRMIGHVADQSLLDGLYTRADLFVFPSLYDNAPMVVREAAAVGTPSLLVHGSSAAEVVEDGVNGLLCRNDENSLAERIMTALRDLPALRSMGEEARRTIPTPWALIMDEVMGRYKDLIASKRRFQTLI